QIAKELNIRFRKAAGSVACPRDRGDDTIRKDKRRHYVMRNAFRPQRCEDREAPVGGFAKSSIKPLSGLDDMLNRAIPVARRRLDPVHTSSDLGTLSTPPDARYAPEFRMERTDMRRGAGHRRPDPSELLADIPYGSVPSDAYRQAATYIDQILRGA